MELQRIITALARADQKHIAPLGFGSPHSYRGDYYDLAFEPAENVTVASMLAHAKRALGATFKGYRGGEYTMGENTVCHIAQYGESGGDRIGPVLIAYLTGKA